MAVLVIISLLLSLFLNNTVLPKKHKKEQRLIFKSALDIIKRRAGITLDQIEKFKELFESHKYFLKPKQEKTIKGLISELGDIRILDEETKPDSAISQEQRKEYINERRVILDRIENIEITIEKYLKNL